MGSIAPPFLKRRVRAIFITSTRTLLGLCTLVGLLPASTSNITGIWANEGGDKVTQDELRVSLHRENRTGSVLNRAWNGQTITLSGAQNEVVSFNLVLEAATAPASPVTVSFDTLTGPNGVQIHSVAASGNNVFNWVNRPIELFYIRYLPIHGLSTFGYGHWDERQIPTRFQRPWSGPLGIGAGSWTDRPDHDKNYPDICVPLELVNQFDITAGQNQSIWSDLYIPKTVPAGTYTGTVTVRENGVLTHSVPVQLAVWGFTLPDEPTAKTMINIDPADLMWRYVTGYQGYVGWGTAQGQRITGIMDKYFELFHRHKLSALGENECPIRDRPCETTVPRLDGSLYTASHGYDGPGVNTINGIYSIGTYGTWGYPQYGIPPWRWDETNFWQHTNNVVTWMEQNLPTTEYHLYLEDEPAPSDYNQVETWAKWIAENPGPGQRMPSLTTHTWFDAQTTMPDVNIPVSGAFLGGCPNGAAHCDTPTVTQAVADHYLQTPGKQLWMYNDWRIASGTADTEDDGVSMRVMAWAQYKKQIHRWFYWYANVNSPIDWFVSPVTWGAVTYNNYSDGQTSSDGASNGFGLLVYPGSSVYANQTSYRVDGPFGSLRIKEWRRGIQDTDYLALASRYNPAQVKAIMSRIVPYVLWEYPDNTPSFYQGSGQSWSVDPDVWEAARAELSQIITAHCASASIEANSPCTAAPANGATAPSPDLPASSGDGNTAPAPLRFVPVTPCRIVDTRLPNGDFSGPYLQAAESRGFLLPGSVCAIPSTARAYALNATVVPHGSLRWLTIWPGGQAQPSVSTLNSLDGRTKANALIVPAGDAGSVSVYATDNTDFILDITGYFVSENPADALVFYPVTPCRLVDTRLAAGALGGPFLPRNQERSFPLLQSSCGLPASAQAYALNYTAIPKQGLAWLTTWPSGQNQPTVSTLNATTNAVTANAAITPAGQNGAVSVYASDDTDLVIDVNGYFAPPGAGGLSFYNLLPCRGFDTRTLSNPNPLRGSLPIDLRQSSCGVPTTAKVLVLNATTIPDASLGYLTLWSTDQARPVVSTLNASDGQITSNLAIVPSTNGSLNAFTTDAAHLIFDVFGYFAP